MSIQKIYKMIIFIGCNWVITRWQWLYRSSLKSSPIRVLFSSCERFIILTFNKERRCPFPPLKFHVDKYHLQKYYVYGVELG